MATLNQLLGHQFVTNLVSRIAVPELRMARVFGMDVGGGNQRQVPGRYFGWDVYDKTRTIAKGRAPGTPPGRSSVQKLGHVAGEFPRAHEEIPILYERLNNTRPLGGNYGEVDTQGERYINAQAETLALKYANWREVLIVGCLRNSLYIKMDGDDLIPRLSDTGNGDTYRINFQVPVANQGQVPLGSGGANLITTTWSSVGANHVQQILNINEVMVRTHGMPLKQVWLPTQQWIDLLKSTEVQNLAGTSMTPFETFTISSEKLPDGSPATLQAGRLRAIPWVDFFIYDQVLSLDGTEIKLIPNGTALFLPEVRPNWLEMGTGSEIIVEREDGGPSVVNGFHAWRHYSRKPAQIELLAIDNAMPFLYIGTAPIFATVRFP